MRPAVRRLPGFLLVSVVAILIACSPAIETLDPVTLQPGPRAPSQIPATGKPEPLDFSEDEARPASAEADAGLEESTESVAGLPPKRRVVSGTTKAQEEDPSLAQVARNERARRAASAPPVASIDDKNIERRAAQAPELIVAPAATSPSEAPDAADEDPREAGGGTAGPTAQDSEAYWRDRVHSLRYQWLDLVAQEEALESKVNGLRRDYYEEDDGYYRDAEIKPEWDAAWEDLQRVREEIRDTIDELDGTVEDGRRAGALPGWLREGVELEPDRPAEEERRRLDTVDPVEPTAINEAAEIDS